MEFKKVKKRSKPLIKALIERMNETDIPGIAAQLAYFFLLSLFPLLIFTVSLLPYLPISQEDLIKSVLNFAPEGTMAFIQSTLIEVMSSKNTGLLSIGILGTLWSASNAMNNIIKAMNRAYDVAETRSFVVVRLMSIVLTIAMIFVVIIALVLPVFGEQIGTFLFSYLGFSYEFKYVWTVVRWLMTPIVIFTVFLGIYFFAPNRKIPLKTAIPGAIFSSIGWIVVSFLFSYYVSNFAGYSSTYGSIGGIIILMVWFYLTGIIILAGGEINGLLTERKRGFIRKGKSDTPTM
jgi:membrane protein